LPVTKAAAVYAKYLAQLVD
jgi:hypothetical protein